MTDDELRIAIAKLKGWTIETKTVTTPTRDGKRFTYTASFWKLPNDMHREPPYWAEDIGASWELMEELTQNFFRVYLMRGDADDNWTVQCEPRKGHDEPDKAWWVSANTAARAICLAWLAWKETKP